MAYVTADSGPEVALGIQQCQKGPCTDQENPGLHFGSTWLT